jgi:glyoxylase I family protein
MDTNIQRSGATLAELPSRLHHYGCVVKDQEVNRRFMEDVLGIPLVATWCEKSFSRDLQRELEFCHTFYAMKDGGAIAFFQFADDEMYARTQARQPAEITRYDHIGFKVSEATYAELIARLGASSHPFFERDHGYCKSVYARSPDGLELEFTVDPANAAEIEAIRRADAHAELARWLSGDHTTNNLIRTH